MDKAKEEEFWRSVDSTLLEEEIVLEGLQRAVGQNSMTAKEAEANFAAYLGTREPDGQSELYRLWVASHNQPPELSQ